MHHRSAALPLATLLTLLTLLTPLPARGQATANPPGKMTFQGFLTDAATPPVPLGNTSPENKSVIFRIYKNATSVAPADLLWAEQQILTIDKGHFSVLLGEGSSVGQPHSTDLSTVFIGADASERWLGITVDNVEITPRIQFFAAPYAQLARAANTLTSGAVFTGNAQVGTSANPAFTLEFGAGKSGKHADAGKIGYESFTTGALDILGAGTDAGSRAIKLWDNVTVNGNLSIGVPASSSFPLRFGPGLANTKIALWDNGGAAYGLGVQAAQFRLHLDTAAARFSFLNAPAGTEVMTINGNGNVGIGKTDPATLVDIGPGPHWRPLTVRGTGGSDAVVIGNISGKAAIGGHTGALNAWADLTLNPGGGAVGIGTSSPIAALHVNGGLNFAGALSHYIDGFGLANWGGAHHPGMHLSGYFSHNVRAGGFYVNSDQRIKQITRRAPGQESLEAIRQLQVTDYTYIDKVGAGPRERTGLIAQEVERVLPDAVSQGTGFVPDIYAKATGVEFDASSQTLALEVAEPHGLKADDLVSLIMEHSGQQEATVASVPTPTSFVVKAEKDPGRVFVFGKQVKDFRTVEYDHVFSTSISALQELDRQVQALQKSEARIAELEKKTARMAELEQKAARVDSLEREMAEMKKLMAVLAQGQAQERLARQNTGTPAGE